MKLQVPVSSAFPAALAAASISLSLVLLPGGGGSVRSSGVAPALKLLAGEVVAAVEKPTPAVKKTQPRHVVATPAPAPAPAPQSAPTHSSPSRTRNVPAHRPVHRVSRPQAVTTTPTPTPAPTASARRPISSLTKYGNGKAKALEHAKRIASQTAAPSAAQQTAQTNGGHGYAYGRPADVSPGPPAVPPGHEENGQSADTPGNSNGRGGGK